MKLHSVEIRNFMGIGEAKINLADRGLVAVQGVNDDDTSANSNGASKSSMADAISWCLYGVTARGEDGDKVVNRFGKGGTKVELQIEDDARTYVIQRYRKDKKFKNSTWVYDTTDPVSKDLTKGTEKLTQEVINQIVGCSHEVFCGAIYAGQERMPDLPGMTDKTLKMLIEEASGATILEAAYKEAAVRLQSAMRDRDATVTTRNSLLSLIDNIKDAMESAKKGVFKFDNDRVETIRSFVGQAKAIDGEIATLETLLKSHDARASIEEDIRSLDMAIGAVAGEQKTLAELERKITTTSAEAAGADRDLAIARKAHDDAVKSVALADHQVGCPCTTCNRPYSAADIAPAKKIAETKAEMLREQAAKAMIAVSNANASAKTATDARDAFKASMTDVSAANRSRASRQAELDQITNIESNIAMKRAARENLKNLALAEKAKVNPFIAMVQEANAKLTKAEADKDAAEANVKDAEQNVKIAEAAHKVFSPAGVRAFLLDEVTPFLNDQTAKYLGTLSDGNITATWSTLVKNGKGELKEKFSIEVTNAHGADTFKGISGGEKRKVRIACALALQDLVARRATKPIDLFIGDEIDDALDVAGLERLMMILEEKARERGSVFIISHNELKDWCRNSMVFRKKGGVAAVEEAVS
jgi:DNA repair exonuclease SbcCD ATPase subunit